VEREKIRRLLQQVRAGKLPVSRALDRLASLPIDDLGFANVDTHRALRRGFPEVVYGPGKSVEQIVQIVRSLRRADQTVLVTRVGPEVLEALGPERSAAEYHPAARALVVRSGRRRAGRPGVVVVSAGTSDVPVAEEASLTAELMGQQVTRIYDVGIAGIHRLMNHRQTLVEARVIVAVAGMEGALPSVIAGFTDCPIIGVPTSTGYGAGAGGEAALLAMLNSCAAGLTVVNIDNGFGAGFAASMINRQTRARRRPSPKR
jgi:NCAIR mutase (PurE)-related protein